MVNMKRTDLSKLVRAKAERESGGRKMAKQKSLTRIVVGHTRFATTSKATFDGTHPHQWSPPQVVRAYAQDQKTPGATSVRVENFITHNGDFDFYNVNGAWVELGDVQAYLARATGFGAPSVVDSAAIAGVVDLLRAQGNAALAARFAVCLDMKTASADADTPVPGRWQSSKPALCFTKSWTPEDETEEKERSSATGSTSRGGTRSSPGCARGSRRPRTSPRSTAWPTGWMPSAAASRPPPLRGRLDAFFDNDALLRDADVPWRRKGSFGLMVTNSLDAARRLCLAARGQTVAARGPGEGASSVGDGAGALFLRVSRDADGADKSSRRRRSRGDDAERDDERDAARLDLDDLNGEVCLLDWGEGGAAVSLPSRRYETFPQMAGALNVVLAMERARLARARDAGGSGRATLSNFRFRVENPTTRRRREGRRRRRSGVSARRARR